MSYRLVSLDDREATDRDVVGSKAAALAEARRAGLPVLPGFVVVGSEAERLIAAATRQPDDTDFGLVRRRMTREALDSGLRDELVAAGETLADRLVVRSSDMGRDPALWSGAFASYAEIAPNELPLAVKGCWASAFTSEAVSRARSAGLDPAAVRIAALVQREIRPEAGGVATLGVDGMVSIGATAGPPAAILSGWERGFDATVDPDSLVAGGEAIAAVGSEVLREVASIVRRVTAVAGYDRIEWALAAGEVWLLQCDHVAVASGVLRREEPGSTAHVVPKSVVRMVLDYPGRLAEDLVLGWALGLESIPQPTPPRSARSGAETLRRIERLVGRLTERRWARDGSGGIDTARRSMAELRGSRSVSAFDAVPEPGLEEFEDGSAVLGLLEDLARLLVDGGKIAHPLAMWQLDLGTLRDLVRGRTGVSGGIQHFGVGRWEPMLLQTVQAAGDSVHAVPAAGGLGVGRVRFVRSPADAEIFRPREVVAAVYPINNLAPLMWKAAALVTVGGAPGAHLFTVAAARGVPAVCGLDIETALGSTLADLSDRHDIAAAVDGTYGTVTLLDTNRK